MMDRPPVKRFAVFAHIGKGNLGDEATMAAVIQNVRLRHPGAEIRAFTLNPVDTQERHKIPSFPIRRPIYWGCAVGGQVQDTDESAGAVPSGLAGHVKQWIKEVPILGSLLRGMWNAVCSLPACIADLAFLRESSRRLKGMDLFIVAGGGQLGDYFGGAWGFPFTILRWSLMAKARGAKLAFLSVGAGPINTYLGKLFFRWSLSLANYRSFRDEGSRRLIASLGVLGENHVFPDLVHGLQPPRTVRDGRHSTSVVGINPLPFHDARYWAEDSPDVYQRYVQTLASFAVWLIEAGHKVLLFPTQVKADPPVIKDVESLIRDNLSASCSDSLMCSPVSSFDDLLSAIAQTDLVVASRFHGIIISLLMSRPVIGLSYNQKMDELMADVGLVEFVADIGRFDVPWLVSRFEQLRADTGDIRCRIESRRSDYRSALEDRSSLLLGETTGPEPCLAPLTT